MKIEQLTRIREWFRSYVDTFCGDDEEWDGAYKLKIAHSGRVAHEIRMLAQALDWSSDAIRTAEAVGWLHDIGRFFQYSEFGTFRDDQSINHGTHGCQVIRQTHILSGLSDDVQQSILDAVCFHNAKVLPSDLGSDSLPLLKLIRDADKLDIFFIVQDALTRDGFRDFPRILPPAKLDGSVNPAVLDGIRGNRVSSINDVRSLADYLLLLLSWIYDINYVPTFQQIATRDIITNILTHLPRDNHVINEVVEGISRHAHICASA